MPTDQRSPTGIPAHVDKDLNDDQRKALRTYLDGLEMSRDFCKPYFEKAVRMARLFNGICPPEIDGTFSKVMLNLGFSMVDSELPTSLRALLGTTDWFTTTASEPELEEYAHLTKKWLQYQMENVQRISATIIPTVQAAHIFGTGYRIYGCRPIPRVVKTRKPSDFAMGIPTGFKEDIRTDYRYVITGQDVNFWNVWPLPGGAQINAFDDASFNCVDGVIWQSFMTEEEIRSNVKNEHWDGVQAEKLMAKRAGGDKNDPGQEYKSQVTEESIGWHSFSTPSWMDRMRTEGNSLPPRYRVAWMFMRDKWIVVGEDRFVLYNGEPSLPFFPIAKFVSSYNMDDWFGRGLIEIVEDLILTTILLLNHRMDYLAGTLHPTTWLSERLMESLGGDKTMLDPEPYKNLTFPTNADISRELFRERFPEISQQAFYEDGKMDEWIQKIAGQPNYGKGMGGKGTLGNETASGIMSLIQQGTARSMMRAANIEESGIRDSLNLTLRLGNMYRVLQSDWVRTANGQDFPWEKIPAEAISEDYRIDVSGTRSMTAAAQTFAKMLQVCQMALTLPPGMLDNPKEAVRQLFDKSAAFENVDMIVGASGNQQNQLPPMQSTMPQPGMNPQQQQQPGPMDMTNQSQSLQNEMGAGAPQM